MSPRITVQTRVRRPRGLRLGPILLWCARIRQGPNVGFGRIAVTDTPRNPAPGQQVMRGGNGWVLILAGIAFAVLPFGSAAIL